MLKISQITRRKAVEFNESEWAEVNDGHFGQGVRWQEKTYRFQARENGKTIGLIFLKHISGTINVYNIIVSKDKRRQGIGTILMRKAEAYGKQVGAHKIWLITGKHYPEDPFFRKLGFKEQAILPDHFFHKDFIIYSRDI